MKDRNQDKETKTGGKATGNRKHEGRKRKISPKLSTMSSEREEKIL